MIRASSTAARRVVPIAFFAAGAAVAGSGLPGAMAVRILEIVSDPLTAACCAVAGAAGAAALLLPETTLGRSGDEREPKRAGLPLQESLGRIADGFSRASEDRDCTRLSRLLLSKVSDARMSWDLADAMVLALRVFSLTGSTSDLERIGAAVADDGHEDVRMLSKIQTSIRTAHPFVDRPVPRNAGARVVLMQAHLAAVQAAGRPVPTDAVVWLKRYDRIAWYGFLNAVRPSPGPYHAEGLPLLLELRTEGRADAMNREALRIGGHMLAHLRFFGLIR